MANVSEWIDYKKSNPGTVLILTSIMHFSLRKVGFGMQQEEYLGFFRQRRDCI